MSKFSKQLMDWSRMLERLNEDLLQEVLENVARRIEVSLIQTFHAQQTPDHKKWSTRKHDKPWPMLYHTGDLDASRKVEVLKGAIKISYDTSYTKWVNKIREILPKDIPEEWIRFLEEELQLSLNKRFK